MDRRRPRRVAWQFDRRLGSILPERRRLEFRRGGRRREFAYSSRRGAASTQAARIDADMNSDRRAAWTIGALTLVWSACFHHTRDWNSASRLLLTHALVEDRTVDVTRFVAVDGSLVRNPPTRDLASPDRQHYFSDKAPGQSYFGAAALGLLRALGVAEDHPPASDFVASRPEKLSL